MSFTEAQLSAWFAAFIWPFIRISALIAASPIFSSKQTPVHFRVGLVLLLTWVLMPVIPASPTVDPFSGAAVLMVAQQVLIGVAMGFVLHLVMAAIVFGGQVIAYSMGLGFAAMMDPQNGVQVPVVSQFYLILATLFFLLLNGHLILIDLLAQSFHTFPVAVTGITQNSLNDIVSWGSKMFSGGLLMGLPVVAALLLVNLGMGIVTRAAPQLNIFAVGFPLAILIGFILIWITLPNVMGNFQELLADGFLLIERILGIVR